MDKRELLDRYEARGDDETYRDALREYEDALAEDPENAALLHDYGYLQECRGRRMLEAAVACYERAIELDPDREKSRLQLIHAQAALGRHDEAIARHRRQLAEVPDSLSEHRLLAYAHLTARDFAAAERVIRAGLELAPDDARLVELHGDVLAGTSQHPEALAAWQRALELNPDNQSPRYSRAFLLERDGPLGEAAAEWREILDWTQARGYQSMPSGRAASSSASKPSPTPGRHTNRKRCGLQPAGSQPRDRSIDVALQRQLPAPTRGNPEHPLPTPRPTGVNQPGTLEPSQRDRGGHMCRLILAQAAPSEPLGHATRVARLAVEHRQHQRTGRDRHWG